MSIDALNWVRLQKVGSASAKSVLRYLADRAHSSNAQCYPKIETVADECELSERAVNEAYTSLKKLGLISTKRRYDGIQRLAGDLVTLHLDVVVSIEKPAPKPRGKAASAKPKPTEQNAESAGHSTVENPSRTQNLRVTVTEQNADFAELNADFAGHNKDEPIRTGNDDDQSSSSVTHRAAPELSALDEKLNGLDPRLTEERITDQLMRVHGVSSEGIDLHAAALVVWSRKSPGSVSNPSAFLAQAIANAPGNPDWASPGWATTGGSSAADCVTKGHRWSGPWNEICLRCDTLRDGWRDDRDSAEAAKHTHEHEFDSDAPTARCEICDAPRSEIRELLEEGTTR